MRALILIAGAALAVSPAAARTRPRTIRSMSTRAATADDIASNDVDRDRRGHRRRRQHGRRRRITRSKSTMTPATMRRQAPKPVRAPTRPEPPLDHAAADRTSPNAPPATPPPTRRIAARAARPICAPGATGASAAAPSPARSPPRAPLRASAQSIGWIRKWRNPSFRARSRSIPSCGHTSFNSSPLRWTTSVPALGLMHSQSSPGTAGKRPVALDRDLESRARAARRPGLRRAGASARPR